MTAMSTNTEAALDAARRLLRDSGLDVEVRAAGREGEIAAIAASPEDMERLRELAPEIRALGFRYVALDLTGTDRGTRE